jgi:hypothetical protein
MGHRPAVEAPSVRERIGRLYGWGSLLSALLLADAAAVAVMYLAAPGWAEVYPVLGTMGLIGGFLIAQAVVLLAFWVLVTDRATPRSRRWLWGVGILTFNFPVAAAFFLAWWCKWDDPLPLFRTSG